MDFIIEMKKAMMLLQKACKMNDEWRNCNKCPFIKYCDAIEDAGFGTPDDDDFLEF